MSMIYFNNGATSFPKPLEVSEAVKKAVLNLPGAANRGGIEDFDVLGEVRRELATLMNIDNPNRIGLGFNATWGLNIAVFGVGLREGDCVVTTCVEHNSVLRPLHILENKYGVKVIFVEADEVGRVDVAQWENAINTYKPKLCVFSHSSNVTGAMNDAAHLTSIAKEKGSLVLLDMAQTLGWADIKLEDWGVDLAAFTGHKFLLGPQGTGGLYVREGIELESYYVGGTGIHSDLDTMPDEMPLHIEAGTCNEVGYYGLLAALKWIKKNPLDRAKTEDMIIALRKSMKELGIRVIEPSKPFTPTVSFEVPGVNPEYVGSALLDSYDIIVRTGLHCAPKIFECLGVDSQKGTVRASFSRYSTVEEINELILALSDVIEAGLDEFEM